MWIDPNIRRILARHGTARVVIVPNACSAEELERRLVNLGLANLRIVAETMVSATIRDEDLEQLEALRGTIDAVESDTLQRWI